MLEVPPPGEDHRKAVFIRGRNHLRIFHRAARLHDRAGAGGGHRIKAVAEREECIRSRNRALEQRRVTALPAARSEEHTSELQSQSNLVCRLLLEKKNDL